MSESQVSSTTRLGGYYFENSLAIHTVFFWQASSNNIYASKFFKLGTDWAPVGNAVLVASDARKDTPITAVNWANGRKAAVYYIDDDNIIHERTSSDNGKTWVDGPLTDLLIPTRSLSDLAAAISHYTLGSTVIYLYFQDSLNYIRELQFSADDGQWSEKVKDGYQRLRALGGTSIACGNHLEHVTGVTNFVGMVSLTKDKNVHTWWAHRNNRDWSEERDIFKKSHDPTTRLGYVNAHGPEQVYAYENGTITELRKSNQGTKISQVGSGVPQIYSNFIVLDWMKDTERTTRETHIFSLDTSGDLWDYEVEQAQIVGTMSVL